MEIAENSRTNFFIFTWKIVNFHYFVREMSSPVFYAHSIESQFRLKLSFHMQPSGESVISFYLQSIQAYQAIELNFELSFLAVDDSPLISKEKHRKEFKTDKQHGFLDFVSLYDILENRSTDFLPQDTLTLRCKIWQHGYNLSESVLCFAETRLGIEQMSFIWPVESFSALTSSYRTLPNSVQTASFEEPVLSMNFQLETASSDSMQFDLELTPEKNMFTIIRDKAENANGKEGFYDFMLTFVNASGDELIGQEKTRLECHEIHVLPVLIMKDMLKIENGYLVDDVLILKCRFLFYKGIVSEGIVSTVYGSGEMLEHQSPPSVILHHGGINTGISSINDIQKFLYYTKMFCDVKLRTNTECLAAHKSILSSKSREFQNMFEENMSQDVVAAGDMKENIFEISDVSADTLRQMILYIYTDSVEGKELENIYQLFVAAIKYKIFTLKKKCFLILRENLGINNACEMLRFANKHKDENLKSFVRDFILRHPEVKASTAWRILERENTALAEEIRLM